jgi:glycosyltransferase involved in cell wall biosynthesis
MEKVCVIIRVYNRIEDLGHCIDIIRDTWKLLNYYIVVVANGSNNGFVVNDETKAKADKFINLEANAGHFKGNSQLLLEGVPYIPGECNYTILLEADTWLYGDELIKKYIEKLNAKEAVWASAQFFSYALNLATDFAIVKSSFIKSHSGVINFEGMPEYYVARFLRDRGFEFVYIDEIKPVNLPKYIKKFPYAPTGRFNIFPKAKMVTHHTEEIPGGMEQKMAYFNAVAGCDYFNSRGGVKRLKPGLNIAVAISYLFPHKSWFIEK